jgi:hypothetical protein
MTDASVLNTRYSQVFLYNEWRDIPNLGLKKGMRFRMFEPTGEIVLEGLAGSDAEVDAAGIIGIVVEEVYNYA